MDWPLSSSIVRLAEPPDTGSHWITENWLEVHMRLWNSFYHALNLCRSQRDEASTFNDSWSDEVQKRFPAYGIVQPPPAKLSDNTSITSFVEDKHMMRTISPANRNRRRQMYMSVVLTVDACRCLRAVVTDAFHF